jgi:hypothetical protein
VRIIAELLLAWLAAVVESTLPTLLGLSHWRPLLAPIVAARLGLVAGPLEGALLTLAAGILHEAVSGLPTGSSTFALLVVQLSTRVVVGGLGLAGRRGELAAGAAGVVLWQSALFVVEHLLGPLDGGLSVAWTTGLVTTTMASLPFVPLLFVVGRWWRPAEGRPLESLPGGRR